MNQRGRRPYSAWTKALAIVAIPVAIFAVILLRESGHVAPAKPTAEYWVAEANRDDGLLWKARHLAYYKLPSRASDLLRLKDPGNRFMRQLNALAGLHSVTNQHNSIVTELTNLLSLPPDNPLVPNTLGLFLAYGTNAIAAVPAILPLLTNPPPSGLGIAWSAIMEIQPDHPETRKLADAFIRRLGLANPTARHDTQITRETAQDGFLLGFLFHYQLAMGNSPAELRRLFGTVLNTERRQWIDNSLWALPAKGQTDDDFEQLLWDWQTNIKPELRRKTISRAIRAAVARERTRDFGLQLFQELLDGSESSPEEWIEAYNELDRHADHTNASPLNAMAFSAATKWILNQPLDHPEDLGEFFVPSRTNIGVEDESLCAWYQGRASTPANPHQVDDWRRHYERYRDVRSSLIIAANILKAGNVTKAANLAQQLRKPDPANRSPFDKIGNESADRYGLGTAKTSGPTGKLKAALLELPAEEALSLLRDLLESLDSLPVGTEHRDEARDRLTALEREIASQNLLTP